MRTFSKISFYKLKYSIERDIAPEMIDVDSEDFLLEYCGSSGLGKPPASSDGVEVCLLPPLLVYGEGRYIPVSGTRCIGICRANHLNIPHGLVIEGIEDHYMLLRCLLHIKKAMGGFNAVEKAFAVKKLFRYRERVGSDLYELLGVPKNDAIIQNYITLSDAPDSIKELVFMGLLHENTAFEIFRFQRKEWESLAKFISSISLGTKKRNNLLSMLFDIAGRDGRGASDILHQDVMKKMLGDERIDPPQRAERVFALIEKMRYPMMYNYREQFMMKLREVGLDRDIHLNLPENFEKWEFRLQFTFSSVTELRRKIEALSRTAGSQSFSELLSRRY